MTKDSDTAATELDRLGQLDKERLNRDVARSQRREKQLLNERKKSPAGMYVAPSVNQYRDQLERRYVPDSEPIAWDKMFVRGKTEDGKPFCRMKPEYRGIYKPGAKRQPYWNSKANHEKTVERGYIPAMNDAGEHVTDGNGDYLYHRAIELTRDDIKRAEMRSQEQIVQGDVAMAAAAKEGHGQIPEDITEVTETATP